jgi:hypothetical protein
MWGDKFDLKGSEWSELIVWELSHHLIRWELWNFRGYSAGKTSFHLKKLVFTHAIDRFFLSSCIFRRLSISWNWKLVMSSITSSTQAPPSLPLARNSLSWSTDEDCFGQSNQNISSRRPQAQLKLHHLFPLARNSLSRSSDEDCFGQSNQNISSPRPQALLVLISLYQLHLR